jgi:thioredoxin reductase
MKSIKSFDVIVVGAGAAGVGVGMALKRVDVDSMILLERWTVGESFRRWPEDLQPANGPGDVTFQSAAGNSPGRGSGFHP